MPVLNSFFPSNPGIFNADDDLVAPWFIPGWTAQNRTDADKEIAPGNNNLLGPGFPSNLAFTQITGRYFDTNSSGVGGFLTLMMSDGILVTDNSQVFRLPQRLTGTMNQSFAQAFNNWGNGALYLRLGFLDIAVFATDQTTDGATIVTDSGGALTYWVTEHMLDGRTYQISVPSSSSPGPVDINSLIIPGSVRPYAYDPVNPMGNMLIPIPLPATVPPFVPPNQLIDIDGGNA